MTTAKQNNNPLHELENCLNVLSFLTTAVVSIIESRDGHDPRIAVGAQICLFNLQDSLHGVVTQIEGGHHDSE